MTQESPASSLRNGWLSEGQAHTGKDAQHAHSVARQCFAQASCWGQNSVTLCVTYGNTDHNNTPELPRKMLYMVKIEGKKLPLQNSVPCTKKSLYPKVQGHEDSQYLLQNKHACERSNVLKQEGKYSHLSTPSQSSPKAFTAGSPDLNSLCLYHLLRRRGYHQDLEFLHLHVQVGAPVSSSLDPIQKKQKHRIQQVSITNRKCNNLNCDNFLPMERNRPHQQYCNWLKVRSGSPYLCCWANFPFLVWQSCSLALAQLLIQLQQEMQKPAKLIA